MIHPVNQYQHQEMRQQVLHCHNRLAQASNSKKSWINSMNVYTILPSACNPVIVIDAGFRVLPILDQQLQWWHQYLHLYEQLKQNRLQRPMVQGIRPHLTYHERTF